MIKKKTPTDINRLAKFIVDQATKEPESLPPTPKEKNPNAVVLGRLGGLKGGKARKKALSDERR
jgi:hypothetical protein